MTIRACTRKDVNLLAKMNRMLIEDEKAPNDMTIAQLEERMRGFLETGYSAFYMESDGEVVGYALVNMSRKPLYLRQFFIVREARRKGYGKAGFRALLEYLNAGEIDIDVYVWNQTGAAFWKALGFSKRTIGMRYRK